MQLWETPDEARRVAETLLAGGPWVLIAAEQYGSWTLWRFVREVAPGDTRSVLLDKDGKLRERTHREGDHEVVIRGPNKEFIREPTDWRKIATSTR